jgi:serine/threonine-protein kinase
MSYQIGSRIGDYEVLEILGTGGMGRVYKVRNVISERIEAMKVLLPDLERDAELADRFVREIKVQGSLSHPNIAALHAALRFENQLIMLMEYVEGTTLEKMMEAGQVPIEKAIDYVAQVLSALSYAHARGVIHRDLKPANIMVADDNLVKLMDFGIAKMMEDQKLTKTGMTVGSLYYMSPEQIRVEPDLDSRSDLYSLGVSLYELVTRTRPFQGDSDYSIMAAHLQGNPLPPIQLSPNLPDGLNEVILQAMQKKPGKRFQTADAFRTALLHVCGPGHDADPKPPAEEIANSKLSTYSLQIPQPISRQRGLWIGIGALIALVIVVIAAIWISGDRHSAAEDISATRNPISTPTDVTQPPESIPQLTRDVTPDATPVVSQELPGPDFTQENAPPQNRDVDASSKVAEPSSGFVQLPAETVSEPNVKESPTQGNPLSSSQEESMDFGPPESVPTAAAPIEDPETTERLIEIQELLGKLRIRAETVRGSLDALRSRQASLVFESHGDTMNSARRMELYIDQTEKALNLRDADAAQKSLGLAEREVSNLEEFFGI